MIQKEKKQSIAFFGSSLVSAYWNGAATYYRGILEALNKRGYRITFFEPDAFERQQHRDIADPEYAEVVVYSAESERDVFDTLDRATGYDIIIKASGVGVFDHLLERSVLEFRSSGSRVIFWDVDAPATLDRMSNAPDDPFRGLVPQYDLIFTYGGGDPVVSGYKSFGAARCVPIYNALNPDTHFPTDSRENFRADLSLLANRMPDRESRIDEFFFKPARLLNARRFLLGGNGWGQNVPNLRNLRIMGHVYTSDHNAFNSSPLAVLNVSRQSMASFGFSPATRVFEAAGAGACIITDTWKGIEQFLVPGKECLTANSGIEVAEILAVLTAERARKIGVAAFSKVTSAHTYDHRAELVDRQLQRLLRLIPAGEG
ncbi:MAG: glycosyltransferase [Chitinivibrionales bacterium]|nr:glycosyltransferase [Chitinivibrionales bacterium]